MKFSILIPAYKRTYLKDCIDSVLNQTFSQFEIIILNDASPESIDSVVRMFNDPRIKYYENVHNIGAINVVDNWNKCLEYATGDYVICIGDDDRLLPNCLEEYSKLICKNPGKAVYHAWTQIIDENNDVVSMQEARPEIEGVFSLMRERLSNHREQFIGDFLFETDRLKEEGGFFKLPLAWGSDDITVFRAAKRNGIANSQIPLFQYRVNSQTISRQGDINIKWNAQQQYFAWIQSILDDYNIEGSSPEAVYFRLIKEKWAFTKMKKQTNTIAKDILSGNAAKKTIFWLINPRKYDVSLSLRIFAIITALKSILSGANKTNHF